MIGKNTFTTKAFMHLNWIEVNIELLKRSIFRSRGRAPYNFGVLGPVNPSMWGTYHFTLSAALHYSIAPDSAYCIWKFNKCEHERIEPPLKERVIDFLNKLHAITRGGRELARGRHQECSISVWAAVINMQLNKTLNKRMVFHTT